MIQNLKALATLSALSLTLVFFVGNTSLADDQSTKTDVFVSGTGGYHSYRIPAVILTPKGTLLAFCEGRKSSRSDHGDLDLVLRRSTDNGRTWTPTQTVYEEGGDAKITIGNPCPVVDQETGRIWLPFCRNNDKVLVTYSDDNGKTWAKTRHPQNNSSCRSTTCLKALCCECWQSDPMTGFKHRLNYYEIWSELGNLIRSRFELIAGVQEIIQYDHQPIHPPSHYAIQRHSRDIGPEHERRPERRQG